MIIRKSLYVIGLAVLPLVGKAQTLQDFSAVIDPNTYFYGTWEGTVGDETTTPNADFVQGAGVYDITGATATNADLSKIEFFFSSPFSIGTNIYLGVTAQALATNAASSFQVVLVDTGGTTATATFTASSFLTGSYSTVSSELTFGGGFLSNSIDSLIITGGIPSGTARFNFSFDEIEALASPIPEPSTYAAIAGLVALGVVCYRRRMIKQV